MSPADVEVSVVVSRVANSVLAAAPPDSSTQVQVAGASSSTLAQSQELALSVALEPVTVPVIAVPIPQASAGVVVESPTQPIIAGAGIGPPGAPGTGVEVFEQPDDPFPGDVGAKVGTIWIDTDESASNPYAFSFFNA